ncbi:MAG: UTP--glucose-1-phosphate uridylyltransferase [Propionibacteriaceae bacterium]|jgi:UTP--glucose-1-phosphate uridylyltransferase|nr:UTP--glucose-1-phosphate uridylyltransferase [Propionibacteriaceae bacterium]
MTTAGLNAALRKMAVANVNASAQAVFAEYYRQLEAGVTGMIAEADVEPLGDVATPDLDAWDTADVAALSRTVLIRLNGGLGTSMGLAQAKSLLPVREGATFLDIIARQVLAARSRYGIRLPLVFLHSYNTRDDCLNALARYPELPVADLPLDMMQSQEPKLLLTDLTPVSWPTNPALEWCPPGHGDLYPTLLESGMLDALIDAGFCYASVSNSDNLGCIPSPALAGWFARSGAPYAAEVTLRTPMDLKGGHIVRRRSDGQLILRETAQTAPEELRYFTDSVKHPFTHTNNLWFDLVALRDKLNVTGGVLGLRLIRNVKTVDPTDKASPQVVQVEAAMGAAIEVFNGAQAVAVPRSRFLPVKTTTELTLLRSDAYVWGDDWVPRAQISPLPVVELASCYKLIADYERRLPHPLGLLDADSLRVEGDWSFGARVQIRGSVTLGAVGGAIPDATVLDGKEQS